MKPVTALQVEKLDALVRSEFETGDWVTLESETECTVKRLGEYVREQIMAERERCAKLALEYRGECGDYWDLACSAIAAAIRSGERPIRD